MRRRHDIRFWLIGLVLAAGSWARSNEPFPVVSLHPIVGDVARAVGGDRVVVHDLIPLGGDPHRFEPTPKDMARMSVARVVFASGKHLEGYLHKVQKVARGEVVEVGRRVPSILVDADDPLFICCPQHAVGCLDPHWWHSPRNMGRAARIIADALAKVDSAGAAEYRANAKAYGKQMEALDAWVRREVAVIPRRERKLATAHLAFGYFCKEYGFRALGLQGLARLEEPTAEDLATAARAVRKEKIRVAFPEKEANPKLLEGLRRETGLRLGGTLIADTLTEKNHSYEAMIRANVKTIVAALKPAEELP